MNIFVLFLFSKLINTIYIIFGGNTYNEQALYIQERFELSNQRKGKKIYTHQTCATDTDQVTVVLDAVLDTVIRTNMNKSGIS